MAQYARAVRVSGGMCAVNIRTAHHIYQLVMTCHGAYCMCLLYRAMEVDRRWVGGGGGCTPLSLLGSFGFALGVRMRISSIAAPPGITGSEENARAAPSVRARIYCTYLRRHPTRELCRCRNVTAMQAQLHHWP